MIVPVLRGKIKYFIFKIPLSGFMTHIYIKMYQITHLKYIVYCWNFPGGPVVKTSAFNAGGGDLMSDWGAKNPCVLGPKQNIKQKQCCHRVNKN